MPQIFINTIISRKIANAAQIEVIKINIFFYRHSFDAKMPLDQEIVEGSIPHPGG
jgi:hypothetical protein